jgi:hypothetical protein
MLAAVSGTTFIPRGVEDATKLVRYRIAFLRDVLARSLYPRSTNPTLQRLTGRCRYSLSYEPACKPNCKIQWAVGFVQERRNASSVSNRKRFAELSHAVHPGCASAFSFFADSSARVSTLSAVVPVRLLSNCFAGFRSNRAKVRRLSISRVVPRGGCHGLQLTW